MTMTLEQVITVVKELPPELREEVGDFALFLRETKLPQRIVKPQLKWRGALRHLRNEYTSVQLQHKALDWWGG
ncbi:MAG: DUF2281 domain-containing protein [Chloroflexi bacterium]|nr:DUF2281 domain-containing protein [Chloroflexota bacterium]